MLRLFYLRNNFICQFWCFSSFLLQITEYPDVVAYRKFEFKFGFRTLPFTKKCLKIRLSWNFDYQRNALWWLVLKFEREKFYPGPGIEPGPLALRTSALPLRHPGQLLIQGRINLFEPILSDLRTTNPVVITSYRGMHSYTWMTNNERIFYHLSM